MLWDLLFSKPDFFVRDGDIYYVNLWGILQEIERAVKALEVSEGIPDPVCDSLENYSPILQFQYWKYGTIQNYCQWSRWALLYQWVPVKR